MEHSSRGFRFPQELVGIIRGVGTTTLVIACMLILVEGGLASSATAPAAQVVAHIEGLSLVVQPGNSTYEIGTGDGGHSIIRARVAAEIDHKWVRSTDYPKHAIRSEERSEDGRWRV